MKAGRANCRARGRATSAGFTLFEVVIALAIAALGLTLLMAAATTGLGNSTLANQYIEATRRAQAHLAELGVVVQLVPGVHSGDDGAGYSWQTRILPPVLHSGARPAEGQVSVGLYNVETSVSWRSGGEVKTVSLQSQRLARQ